MTAPQYSNFYLQIAAHLVAQNTNRAKAAAQSEQKQGEAPIKQGTEKPANGSTQQGQGGSEASKFSFEPDWSELSFPKV
jgi:hypothetical protein